MAIPLPTDRDISVLVRHHYDPCAIPSMRTTVKVLDTGHVVIYATGCIDPIYAAPGQEIVIDLSMDSPVHVAARYDVYRLTPQLT